MKKARISVVVAGMALVALGTVFVLREDASAVLLTDAVAHAQADGTVAITVAMSNPGAPVTLLGISSAEAAHGDFTDPRPLILPGGSNPALALDGAHGKLTGLDGDPRDGRLIPVLLTFSDGMARTKARFAGPDADPHAGHTMMTDAEDMSLSVAAEPDGDGWMLRIDAPGLAFSESAADGEHVPGQGHGHLYLNGLKLQRIYAPEVRIGPLPPGAYDATVSLNANDHRAYAIDGQPLEATTRIEVR